MQIKPGDLDHPQTCTIIHWIAEECLGKNSDQAAAVAERAVGMSAAVFKGWMEHDDDFQSRW